MPGATMIEPLRRGEPKRRESSARHCEAIREFGCVIVLANGTDLVLRSEYVYAIGSPCREAVNSNRVIALAGLQLGGGEIRMIRGIGKVLRLQAQCGMQLVWLSALAFD